MSISSEMFAEIIRKRDAEIERLRKVIGDLVRWRKVRGMRDAKAKAWAAAEAVVAEQIKATPK
jgi:hypothetical protein